VPFFVSFVLSWFNQYHSYHVGTTSTTNGNPANSHTVPQPASVIASGVSLRHIRPTSTKHKICVSVSHRARPPEFMKVALGAIANTCVIMFGSSLGMQNSTLPSFRQPVSCVNWIFSVGQGGGDGVFQQQDAKRLRSTTWAMVVIAVLLRI
jgi:hypothetical protein